MENLKIITCTLHEDRSTLFDHTSPILLTMRNIPDKSSVENQNTFLCRITFFKRSEETQLEATEDTLSRAYQIHQKQHSVASS